MRSVMLLLAVSTSWLRAATPVEPVGAIVEAFQTRPIVALGNVEFRGNEQSHRFQVALIRDARIQAVVSDIVVEFGTAKYQDVMDRFVLDGEDVPIETLRQAWQQTTQIEYEWDRPIYEQFFRAVRDVNRRLPRQKRLRVLLGDPPMDWSGVRTREDLDRAMGDRDGHAVEVIRREVLAKGRKALVIYGGYHLFRKNKRGIVARLEEAKAGAVFSVVPETRRDLTVNEPSVASWPVPSLALNSAEVRAETGDALLYLGAPSTMTMSPLSPEICKQPGYVEMRLGRLGLVGPPPGAAKFPPLEQLKALCKVEP